MEVKIGVGIGELTFGMLKPEIEKLLGTPDKEALDQDDDEVEIIWQFNASKSRISFYSSEEGRLGYIRCSSNTLTYKGHSIIGEEVATVLTLFEKEIGQDWDVQEYDSFVVYVNENYWLSISCEYEVVTHLEIGVPFLDDEEYNWPPLKESSSRLKVVH